MEAEQFVWVGGHPEFEWWPCKVVECRAGSVVAQDNNDGLFTIPIDSAVFVRPSSIRNVADLLHLDDLTEGHLLHAVRTRFFDDQIYTAVGSQVLLAVNPYKTLDCFSDELKRRLGRVSLSELQRSAPHIFRTTELAYRNMQEGVSRGQNILISGESGAGKTESAKFAINYLAGRGGHSQLETKILSTNPLLEAFGNAQTIRNENSSRFGKFLQLSFRDGVLSSGRVESYLLEKSRVVSQAPNERNYHIFYQLYFGCDETTDVRLQLKMTRKYEYLNLEFSDSEDKSRIDGLCFLDTLRDLNLLGFSEATKDGVLEILAGILHLGNLRISGGSEGSFLHPECPHKAICARLFGVSPDKLENLLCFRPILDPSTKTLIKRNVDRAAATVNRDTLAQTVYDRLFGWLVTEINGYLCGRDGEAVDATSHIGVLDIFGFEVFAQNSLEQLCINFANERLQQGFVEDVFKAELRCYAEEGVSEASMSFRDNQRVVDLIDKRPVSVFSLLEEESLFHNSSDLRLLERLRLKFEKQEDFIARNLRVKKECFGIRHFAGEVFYTVEGFLEKNRSATNSQLIETLCGSANKVLETVFRRERELTEAYKNSKRAENLVAQFSGQLNTLMGRLSGSFQLFVRCLKPNKYKSSDMFDSTDVNAQLRAVGVLDVIRVRKAGYPLRRTTKEFQDHFSVLLHSVSAKKLPLQEQVSRILCTFRQFTMLKVRKDVMSIDKSLVRRSGVMSLSVLRYLRLDNRQAKTFWELWDGTPTLDATERCVRFGHTKVLWKEEANSVLEFVQQKAKEYFARKVTAAMQRFRRIQLLEKLVTLFQNGRLYLALRRNLVGELAQIERKRAAGRLLEKMVLANKAKDAIETGIIALHAQVREFKDGERRRMERLQAEPELVKKPETREIGHSTAHFEVEMPEVLHVQRTRNPEGPYIGGKSFKKKTTQPNFKLAPKNFPEHVRKDLEKGDVTGPPVIDILDVDKAVSNILDINKKNFRSYAGDGPRELELSSMLAEKEGAISGLRSEMTALKEQLEEERTARLRAASENNRIVAGFRQEVGEKDALITSLRKELRVARAESKDFAEEGRMLREEIAKNRGVGSNPGLKNDVIEKLESLNFIIEQKDREMNILQHKFGEAKETVEALQRTNLETSQALKERETHLDKLQKLQSERDALHSQLGSQLALTREAWERKGTVYKEVVEDLLTLVHWADIHLKLKDALARCADPVKLEQIRMNIAQLRQEEEGLREQVDLKLHLMNESQVEGGQGEGSWPTEL